MPLTPIYIFSCRNGPKTTFHSKTAYLNIFQNKFSYNFSTLSIFQILVSVLAM